ncbi:MAG: diguanylate cyclase [Candidatus Muiribacteriaceae bacterium]
MDDKNITLISVISLIAVFAVNILLNIAFPLLGNNVIVFLFFVLLCIGYTYLTEDIKSGYILAGICSGIMLFFLFFSDINIEAKISEMGLEQTFGNYIIIIFGFGLKNLINPAKLFIDPAIVQFICAVFLGVYMTGKAVKPMRYLREKLKNTMNNLKEIDKYRQDNERYEKTIEELQGKVVEVSSRTLVLKDFASEIGSSFEPREIFDSIIEATVKLLDSDCTLVLSFDKNRKLKLIGGHNVDKEEWKDRIIEPDVGIVGMILKNRHIITADDIEKNFQLSELHKMDKIDIQLAAPIQSEEGQIYALLVISKMKNRISKEHVRMFSILNNIATLSLENSKLFKKVEFMANVDGLTKLYTHRYFQDFLSEELARATRYKRPLSVIMSDIDHFKDFNDKYGHQTGDLVLEETAKVFKGSVRNKVDLVARYGGEEFIAVLPETDLKAAFVVADRLREKIAAATYESENNEKLRVTVSLGIAGFPYHSTEKLDLIKKADTALYYAKENGRNQVQIFNAEKMKIVEM